MEMFLMVAAMSLLGVAVCGVLFAAATRDVRGPLEARSADQLAAAPAKFFVDIDVDPASVRTQIPVEALLLQIERHVRLEQAAAESFHFTPTPESLHMTTTSPLLH
jgi:hypothetical protein